MLKIVLCDTREKSPTKGVIQECFIGDENYALVHIPPGIANASKAISGEFAIFCNVASMPHDPNIKYTRIDPDSGEIPYDWNKRNF